MNELAASNTPPGTGGRAASRGAVAAEVLRHPIVVLVGTTVVAGAASRALFFALARWLWGFETPLPDVEVTAWARWATKDRDGIEPYALLLLTVAQVAAVIAAMSIVARVAPRRRAITAAGLLLGAALFAAAVPPALPMRQIAPHAARALLLVVGALATTWLLSRVSRRGTTVSAGLAAALIPICFIPISLPSLTDLPCVLAPALRLQHGVPLAKIYFQYDLLPSLLALGWSRIGGAPLAFTIVVRASYYAALLGVFVLAARLFRRPELAVFLLVSAVLVRLYGNVLDAAALPQISPLRLELWLPLLATALAYGLGDWRVGFVLALLCFFSRSMGTLYLSAYALALAADLFARRRATPPAARRPLGADLAATAARAVPAVVLVALSFAAARIVFGAFGSDAVALYRRLGVGMMRIERGSFYWWLLPLVGAVGWLACARRGSGVDRRAEARLFAVALVIASSIYFFGRSHEHNLVNLATSFFLLFFLGLDLAWTTTDEAGGAGARPVSALLRLAPWAVVAVVTLGYSGRILDKLEAQRATTMNERPLPFIASDVKPVADCGEIAGAVGDRRVFFFSKYDYWLYQECGYAPEGYVQPLFLVILRAPLITELNRLLDDGYKIVVPRAHDWGATFSSELAPLLASPTRAETPHYEIYHRAPAPP